jgi:hypothetical protein
MPMMHALQPITSHIHTCFARGSTRKALGSTAHNTTLSAVAGRVPMSSISATGMVDCLALRGAKRYAISDKGEDWGVMW